MATSVARWDDLLAGEELAYLGTESGARGPARAAAGGACTRGCAKRSRRRESSPSTHTRRAAWEAAQRGEHLVVTTGTASGKTLAFNLPVLDALAREPKQRALYLYPTKALAQDQLRSLGSFGLPKLRAAIYDGDTADRAPLAGAQVGEPDPLQPGHAPRGRAAAPRPLGRRALEPRLRDRGRGARLPRRLRLARGQRAAAAAAPRSGLRRGAAVPARLGHDREPGRAGHAPARNRDDGDRRRRGAARRAHRGALEPALHRRGARPAREPAGRGLEADGRSGLAPPAHALLRQEPARRRADPPLHRRPARRRLGALALSRGLHAGSSGARSSGACSRASCSASRRRTRSSSGSTSACSTA